MIGTSPWSVSTTGISGPVIFLTCLTIGVRNSADELAGVEVEAVEADVERVEVQADARCVAVEAPVEMELARGRSGSPRSG